MSQYTVIGMGPFGQYLSEIITAETAAEAEQLFTDEADRIAGVLEGAHVVDSEEVHEQPVTYTVVAYYPDTEQRYATSTEACSGAEAARDAIVACNYDIYPERIEDGEEGEDFDDQIIVVCGVVAGNHQCADIYAGGEGSIWERASDDDERYERECRGLPSEPVVAKPGPRVRPSELAQG